MAWSADDNVEIPGIANNDTGHGVEGVRKKG